MNESTTLSTTLIVALLSGLAGGFAMNALMRILSKKQAVPVDMIRVIGALVPVSRDSKKLGTAMHLGFGILFGLLYLWALDAINHVSLPAAIPIGLGFGVAHGIIASILLMYLARDTHPREKVRQDSAIFAIGLVYVAGHAAYGITVGLVGGLLMLASGTP